MTKKVIMWCIISTSIITLICISFIFGNSLKDSLESSQQSSNVMEILIELGAIFGFEVDMEMSTLRNFAHFIEFFALGTCLSALSLFLAKRKGKLTTARIAICLFLSVIAGIITAITDELLQHFSNGRVSDINDVFTDSKGVVAGTLFVLVIFLLYSLIKRSHNKNSTTN